MKCVFCKKEKAEYQGDILSLRTGDYAGTSLSKDEDGICTTCLSGLKEHLDKLK